MRKAELGVFNGSGRVQLSEPRADASIPTRRTSGWRARRRSTSRRSTVHLRILVDTTSIEVFVDDGRYVHTSAVFPNPADNGIALYSVGGTATFTNVTIKNFANNQQRGARLLNNFEGTDFGPGWTATGSFAGPGAGGLGARGKVEASTSTPSSTAATRPPASSPHRRSSSTASTCTSSSAAETIRYGQAGAHRCS